MDKLDDSGSAEDVSRYIYIKPIRHSNLSTQSNLVVKMLTNPSGDPVISGIPHPVQNDSLTAQRSVLSAQHEALSSGAER